MKTLFACKECGVAIGSGEYCKLCAPYMVSNLEVTMEDLDVFEIAELEALADDQAELYSSMGNQWDMVEDHIRTHGTHVEYDVEGHEVDVEQVLNKPVQGVYVPSESAEFDADQEAGSWLSPAALMVHASELADEEGIMFVEDYNDAYVELVHYNTNVFTRKNTISEDQALQNLLSALARLDAVDDIEAITALGKEIGSAQMATVYSKMYYFPKSCSKYFWSLYKQKKAKLSEESEVIMQNHINRLNACTTVKEMGLIAKEVYGLSNCPAKAEFWAVYKAKKEAIYSERQEQRRKLFVELCSLIQTYSSFDMLNKVRQEIYNCYLPLSVKKALWDKIQVKLQTGSVSINVEKGIQYMESEVAKYYADKAKAAANTAA